MRTPKIGDIWYNNYGEYHFLVLADDYEMGLDRRKGYRMLILESGKLDAGWIEHFHAQCRYIS